METLTITDPAVLNGSIILSPLHLGIWMRMVWLAHGRGINTALRKLAVEINATNADILATLEATSTAGYTSYKLSKRSISIKFLGGVACVFDREAESAEADKCDGLDFRLLAEYFNTKVDGTAIPKVSRITDDRKRAVVARMETYGKDKIKQAIDKTASSDFLCGRVNSFKATFDWIFRPSNFLKIIEGNFDNPQFANGTRQQQQEYNIRQHILAKLAVGG